MNNTVKRIAIQAALTFAKGAVSGFLFTLGGKVAARLFDAVLPPKNEPKRNADISVREVK